MEFENPHLGKRDLNVPLYQKIVSDIERQIRTGALSPGHKLPSEAELQEMYDVSRTPVRKALDILELNGLIYRSQGRGSFVSEESFRGIIREIGTGRSWRLGGKTITVKPLSIRELQCDQTLADESGFMVGDRLIELRRLFMANGSPAVFTTHYLRPIITIDRLRSEGNFPDLYRLLEQLGFEPSEVSVSISAKILESEEAAILNVTQPMAGLLIKHTYFAMNGRRAWFLKSLVVASNYEYHIQSRRAL